MSRKIENHCVNCVLPCIGSSCPYHDVPVDYCDACGDEGAIYRIDGEDLCEDCAEERVKEIFDDMTLSEKAEVVNIDLEKISN